MTSIWFENHHFFLPESAEVAADAPFPPAAGAPFPPAAGVPFSPAAGAEVWAGAFFSGFPKLRVVIISLRDYPLSNKLWVSGSLT